MAIAYGTTGSGTLSPTSMGTSKSISLNVGTGTDRILWVGFMTGNNTTDVTTSLTYGGVAMTKLVGRRLNTSTQYLTLWYLVNPASGSNTLAWTGSANEDYCYAAFTVFTGVPAGTYGVGSNTDSQDVASGTLTLTLTTQYDNAWLVSIVRSTDYGDHSAGTGTTERSQLALSIGDSNGGKTPTGSHSMAWASIPSSGKIGGVMGHFIDVATANVTVSGTVQSATFTVPAYTVIGAAIASPVAQSANFTIPTYEILSGNAVISPNVQECSFVIPASDIKTGAIVMPDGQVLTFTVPEYSIALSIVVSPSTVTLTFVTPTLAKVGAVWVKRGRSTNATWVKSTRNSN